MKKKIRYTDEPLDLEVVQDFLPPPEKLLRRQETVKVTLSLTKPSLDFFKQQARRQHLPYQKMIRQLLDLYAARFQ